MGKGNSISRGDIAILSVLVDERLLSEDDKDRLLSEELLKRENRKVIVIKLEKVEEKAKEAEESETFRKMFEEYK